MASTRKKTYLRVIIGIALFVFILKENNAVFAQTMTSNSYIVQSSSVNCGGGSSASSTYALYDSVCELGNATSTNMTSASYILDPGFQAMKDISFITLSLSGNTISLGTLSTLSVASGTVTATVTTNATTGYTSTIIADGALRRSTGDAMINTDGGIVAGDGEYGFTTSGADGQFNSSDTCIPYSGASTCTTSAKTYATNTGVVSGRATTITLKAATSTTTPSGSYSQTITLITTGTF